MDVTVGLSGGTATFSNFSGELKHDSGLEGDKRMTRSAYVIAVYPDTNVANADINRTGAGANLFGKISFEQSKVIRASGVFGANDFTQSTGPNGSNVARPAAGLTKSVSGLPVDAVIVVYDEAELGQQSPLPAVPPMGIGLLSLLLLVSGVWVMRGRVQTA